MSDTAKKWQSRGFQISIPPVKRQQLSGSFFPHLSNLIATRGTLKEKEISEVCERALLDLTHLPTISHFPG